MAEHASSGGRRTTQQASTLEPQATQRVAWVTGGSRGIGAATARRLARLGHTVAVGFHEDQLAADTVLATIEDEGGIGIAVGGDLGDPNHVASAHDRIEAELGAPTVVVASHGIYERTAFADLTLDAWERTLGTNLTSNFLLTKAVLPAMMDAGWGRIVYLGSILGRIGSSHGAHYAATKAALHGLARSVAKENAEHGITANVVAASMIDTDILASDTPEQRAAREHNVPVGRIGTAAECASAIAYLVSPAAAYVTGTELRLDGGYQMG